jgi:hypothetical protein
VITFHRIKDFQGDALFVRGDTRRLIGAAVGLAATFAVISLSFGQPVAESLAQSLRLAFASLVGCPLARHFSRNGPITTLEHLVLGYFLFVVVVTLSGLILGFLGLPVPLGVLPAFVLAGIAVSRRPAHFGLVPKEEEHTRDWLIVAGLSSALLLAPFHLDGLVVALLMVPVGLVLRRASFRSVAGRVTILSVSATAVAVSRYLVALIDAEPLRARIVDQDVIWDESVTKGVVNLGFDTSPALLGEPIRYHIGSHIWGAISDMATFSDGLSSSGLGGTLAYGVMLSIVFIALARQLGGRSPLVALAGLLGVATALPSPIPLLPTHHPRAHQTFALFVLIASSVFVLRVLRAPGRVDWLSLAVIGFMLVSAKLHAGMIGLLFLAPCALLLPHRPFSKRIGLTVAMGLGRLRPI